MKVCARDGCTKPIVRRHRESTAQAERRLHCSLTCYHAAVKVEKPSRTCEHCDKEFGPSRSERASQFLKRRPRYCSQKCNGAAKTARAAPPERTCARDGCKAVLVARTGESPAALGKRKFCGVSCARTSRPSTEKPPRRAPARARRTKTATATSRPGKAPLSVFGDVAPATPWRPAGFSPRPDVERQVPA